MALYVVVPTLLGFMYYKVTFEGCLIKVYISLVHSLGPQSSSNKPWNTLLSAWMNPNSPTLGQGNYLKRKNPDKKLYITWGGDPKLQFWSWNWIPPSASGKDKLCGEQCTLFVNRVCKDKPICFLQLELISNFPRVQPSVSRSAPCRWSLAVLILNTPLDWVTMWKLHMLLGVGLPGKGITTRILLCLHPASCL